MQYTSTWYTRAEQTPRSLIWGSMQGLLSIVFGLVSWGCEPHASSQMIRLTCRRPPRPGRRDEPLAMHLPHPVSELHARQIDS